MKRHFHKIRDDRFALTTLQNPYIEVRTHAQLVQAAQQEREWQARAAQIAAPQAPAPPQAPSSIPVSELPAALELPEELSEELREELSENVASTAPDLAATAPAPLDSPVSDSIDPDSTNADYTDPGCKEDAAQELLDSLVAGVLAAGSSPRSSDSLSLSEGELLATPSPRPRGKRKSKARRRSKPRSGNAFRGTAAQGCASAAASTEDHDPDQDEADGPTPLQRHARKCAICKHPGREYIEEAFLQWRSPDTIKRLWDLQSRTTIYHHAHAFDLFALRTRNLHLCLGNIIEGADDQCFTATHILHAIRFLAHINEDGRWTQPTHKSEVTYSVNRLPAVPGLPAGQARLPTHPNAQPTDPVSEPKLIATQ
jgi:hypothetical protein